MLFFANYQTWMTQFMYPTGALELNLYTWVYVLKNVISKKKKISLRSQFVYIHVRRTAKMCWF